MTPQLPLALRWPMHQRFDTFLAGINMSALEIVRHSATHSDSPWLFLTGISGSGKSHLLLAACSAAATLEHTAQYLSLAAVPAPRADAIRAGGGSDLLAIDDIDAIVGDTGAEHALFDLYNRCYAEGTTLLFAGSVPPTQLGLSLPDLASRLSACTHILLRPLDEAGRREALRQRAVARGFELDDAVLDWLFTRQLRDLGTLTTLLERVDIAALAAQRRITVPFLRQLIERDSV